MREGRCEGITVTESAAGISSTARTAISWPPAVSSEAASGRTWTGSWSPSSIFPVFQPAGRGAWFGERFFDPEAHPIHRAGIVTDDDLRPVDETGRVVLENVRVAGSILAHHQAIEEKSREGIDIATGFWAAERALAS